MIFWASFLGALLGLLTAVLMLLGAAWWFIKEWADA